MTFRSVISGNMSLDISLHILARTFDVTLRYVILAGTWDISLRDLGKNMSRDIDLRHFGRNMSRGNPKSRHAMSRDMFPPKHLMTIK